MNLWWASTPDLRLSQGDIVSDCIVATPTAPLAALSRQMLAGGMPGWKETASFTPDSDGHGHVVARGVVGPALVLSHSCTLDKDERKKLVLVAPVINAARLKETDRERVMKGGRFSLLPLPSVPNLGDAYADLRMAVSIRRNLIALEKRIASPTKHGLREIQRHLVGFLVRSDLSAVAGDTQAAAVTGDAEAPPSVRPSGTLEDA